MKVVLLDLGVGNLHSLEKALLACLPGAEVSADARVEQAIAADLLVLPGVGAFAPAAARLAPDLLTLRAALDRGQPCLGICLGMQLLFESSEEGPGEGIGVMRGPVTRLAAKRLPHMGWSRLDPRQPLELPESVYFAHSFACRPSDPSVVCATSTIEGDTFPAIVRHRSVVGAQFHPEKSSRQGVELLGRLARMVLS